MTLAAHPATNLFPMMDEASLQELADDIKRHGLQYPVVLHEGMILDGRNRVAACELTGHPVETVRWESVGGVSPTEWVIATNLHRRHLTTSQRAAIAAEALPMLEAEARERQGHGLTAPNRSAPKDAERSGTGRAADIAARSVGVGSASVQRAKRLRESAPEVFEQVKAGEMTVTAGLREAGSHDSHRRSTGQGNRGQLPVRRERTAPSWLRLMTMWLRRSATLDDRKWLLQIDQEVHATLAVHGINCTHEEISDGAASVA